jgi:hypothetical protein
LIGWAADYLIAACAYSSHNGNRTLDYQLPSLCQQPTIRGLHFFESSSQQSSVLLTHFPQCTLCTCAQLLYWCCGQLSSSSRSSNRCRKRLAKHFIA